MTIKSGDVLPRASLHRTSHDSGNLFGVILLLLLSGCAHYRQSPLPDASAVFAPSSLAILSADAARIDRPELAARSINFSAPLTLDALAVLAVLENPDLKAQRTRLGVNEAQSFAARLLPDPTIQGSFDKLLSGPDSFNAFAGQLALDVNQLRMAGVTRAAAAATKRQVRLDLAWAEWQTAGQARLQGVRVLALQQQLPIARESSAVAEHLLEAVARAAGRGDIAAGEVDIRRQSALDATDKARTAEAELVTAQNELAKLLGLPPGTALSLAQAAEPASPPPAAALLQLALDRRLDLQALRAGYDAAEVDVRKAVLEQFPTLSLTLTGGRDTSNNYTLGPAIGFTLPLWNRNRGGIAVASATREQLKAEYVARLFQTRAEIAAAVAAVETLRRQRDALLDKLPAIQNFAAASGRAAARGDLAPALAATAQQAVRDRNLTLSQLNQQIAEQTIALELLSGGPSEGWTR